MVIDASILYSHDENYNNNYYNVVTGELAPQKQYCIDDRRFVVIRLSASGV